MSEPSTSSNPSSAEILKLFSQWRLEAISPLTMIVGYATMLLTAQNENLTEQQKQSIAVIRQAGLKSYSSWRNPSEYLELIVDSENRNWKWEPVRLLDVCERILSTTALFINKSKVRLNISESLPPVRADLNWLSRAILNMLEPSVGYHYNEVFESSVSAEETDATIAVKIATGLELSMDPQFGNLEYISIPGNSLSVASMIIERHGSRLGFRRLPSPHQTYQSQGTEFEFVLPTWR
jgi:K+-sensing histidine kinase KdpD